GPMQAIQFGRAFRSALIVATLVSGGCGFKAAGNPTGTGGTGATTGVGGGGSSGSTGTGGSTQTHPTSLSIDPPTATLTVTNASPTQTQQYTVTGMVNGQSQDLTSQVIFTATPNG